MSELSHESNSKRITSKDVPCPVCGAQPGEPCHGSVRANRGHRKLTSSHRSRIDAARKAK